MIDNIERYLNFYLKNEWSVYEDITMSNTLYIYDSDTEQLVMELYNGHTSYLDKSIGNEICSLFSIQQFLVEEICEGWVYKTFKFHVRGMHFKGNQYISSMIKNMIGRSKLIKENNEVEPYTNPNGPVHHYLKAHLNKKWVIKKRDGDFWIFNPDDNLWVMYFDKTRITISTYLYDDIYRLFIDEDTLAINEEVYFVVVSLVWGFMNHTFNHEFKSLGSDAGSYKLYQFDGPNLSVDEVRSELNSVKENINKLVSLIREQL